MKTSSSPPELDQRRPFGATGLAVSPIGFGGAPIGNLGTDPADVRRVLDMLLDHGVNLIDTAHVYGDSEEMIGAALRDRKDDLVLVTKCGSKWGDDAADDDGGPAWSPAYIRHTIDRSLKRLGVDHVDVMLLHTCDLATLEKGEALGAVLEARQAGKVRFAGFSGDNEAAAWAAQQPDIAVIQTSVSICDQRNVDDVLPLTARHDVGVMAKRPVANGAWKPVDEQYEGYKRYAQPYHDRFEAMGLSLDALREACGGPIEWPELALRFTLSIPEVHTAIVGTTRVESAEANLHAAARGPLRTEAVEMIQDAFQLCEPPETWPGLT